MNIIQIIERANYAATASQVETLAHTVVLGKRGESTYLRVLTAHCQAEAGTGRRKMRAEDAEAIIDRVHARLYPSVQKGVASNGLGEDGEVPQPEINRRSTFARTSASELRTFVNRGGDIRGLKVPELTRAQLRKFGAPVPVGTRAERSLQKSSDAMVRAAKRIARNDPDKARERIEATIKALQDVLDEVEGVTEQEAGTTTVVGKSAAGDRGATRTRVGVPQLHRGA
jgi:hypothetical protein